MIQINTAHVIPLKLYLEASRVTDLLTELDPDRAVVDIERRTAVDSAVLELWPRLPLQESPPKPWQIVAAASRGTEDEDTVLTTITTAVPHVDPEVRALVPIFLEECPSLV